jgi:hypothetical protein
VLRAGAVGASVVWAAPAIRSAGIDDRFIGSPGLATTTTDPQPTIVMFAGSFSAAGAATNPPECAVRQVATSGSFNLGDIGNGTVSFDACLNAVFNVIGGTFTITTAAGTMSGTLDSGSVTLMAQPPLPFEFFGTITGGTDGFLGASGSIVLDGNINDFPGTSVSGSITGTATIP